MLFRSLAIAVMGLVLSAVALAHHPSVFAKAGLAIGISGALIGLVTSIGWLFTQDPREEWIIRVTASADADVQLTRRKFNAALKRYREQAVNEDHDAALEDMTKDLMALTQAYKNLMKAAAATPRFARHVSKLEDLRMAFLSFREAVKLQDKIEPQEAIDRTRQSPLMLKELLDLWDLHHTGQLTLDSLQAKFRDY